MNHYPEREQGVPQGQPHNTRKPYNGQHHNRGSNYNGGRPPYYGYPKTVAIGTGATRETTTNGEVINQRMHLTIRDRSIMVRSHRDTNIINTHKIINIEPQREGNHNNSIEAFRRVNINIREDHLPIGVPVKGMDTITLQNHNERGMTDGQLINTRSLFITAITPYMMQSINNTETLF